MKCVFVESLISLRPEAKRGGILLVEYTILPTGQLSEEALQVRNKDIRKYRADFSRKISRTKTLEDV